MHAYFDRSTHQAHHMHVFSDRSTNQATTCISDRSTNQATICMLFQTEVQIRTPKANIHRQMYKSGHQLYAFTDRSTNQATRCMHSQTEVDIRPDKSSQKDPCTNYQCLALYKCQISNLIFLFFLYSFIYYKEFYSFIYL